MRNNIEMPNKIQRIGSGLLVFLTYLIGFMTILGLMVRDDEMAIVCFVITAIFAMLVFFTRRKFKAYYEETADYFLLEEQLRGNQHLAYRVYYKNITNWVPLSKKIGVLDKTRTDNKYIYINFAFAKPEILLRELTEMTFSGKFNQADSSQSDDPNREQEFMDHLQTNHYGHLIEEFLKEQHSSEGF